MIKSSGQPAYVLHQWDWSETSLILDLFTREQGRVATVAKGAKRPYSQLRAVLLPFQRIHVALGRPKADEASDILTLRSAEYGGAAAALPPAQLFSGFYLNELLMKLLARQDAHALLFDAYADTLQALAVAQDEAPLRAFELVLLRETGVLPELNHATLTQSEVQAGQFYALRPEAGLVAAGGNEPALAGAACLALQAALDANEMTPLRQVCSSVLPALRPQLRSLLHYHLGSPQLRTRAAMLEVRRLLDATTHPGTR
ncbi:DNA repair protein RecO [Aquabacterium sp.]|uniref:DNA repair protein RecO n=1 Tax=Aquabacterium sp. TaxID=1872578 RepID=UPI002C356131|nr:DNA repair protein RecO [Aquabacterium sp.]HSW04880.1 DNA repair protein RecO [Aquabacterium sp.]